MDKILIHMVIRLTDLYPISSGRLISATTNILTADRFNVDRLLNKPVEQQSTRSGGSAIKAKNKLIQIVIQMGSSWRALMSSLQPTLQQRNSQISQRQQIVSNIGRFTNNRMFESRIRQLLISFPTIRANFTFGLDTIFNRRYQALSRSIFNFMQTDAARAFISIFDRHNNQRFAFGATPAFSRSFTSYISFINLHRTLQPITARTNHRNSQFMEQSPCCFVSVQSQNLLQPKGAHSMLLADNLPYRSKPYTQGYSRVFKNCASRNRGSIFTMAASVKPATHTPAFSLIATRADKPFRPTKLINIFATTIFSRKTFFKLKHSLGIGIHGPSILHIVVRSVNRITITGKITEEYLAA